MVMIMMISLVLITEYYLNESAAGHQPLIRADEFQGKRHKRRQQTNPIGFKWLDRFKQNSDIILQTILIFFGGGHKISQKEL